VGPLPENNRSLEDAWGPPPEEDWSKPPEDDLGPLLAED